MSTAPHEVALFGYATTALVHVGFVAYLLMSGRLQGAPQRPRVAFVAALLLTSVWAGLLLSTVSANGRAEVIDLLTWLAACADWARYGLWYVFLLTLFGLARQGQATFNAQVLRWGAGLCLLGAGTVLLLRAIHGLQGALTKPELAAVLALPVCGMLMVEQIFRGLGEESRWSAKPMCVGLGCVFAFDIYLYSEALLFGRFDIDALSIRGAVHSLAVPFLFIASRRGSDWIVRLKVSRSAAFYSATLILAGAYLLFMSAIGYYVRFFGGDWGRALQLGLLVAALALLGMLLFSGSLRSWLRVFVGKHFYSYRYDYREEWLRFTGMLTSKRSPQEMGELIVRGLAKMVECPGGALWTRTSNEPEFAQSASWNWGPVSQTEALGSSLCMFLHDKGWVIDLDEFRSSPRKYGELALPTWLLSSGNSWLVVPLLAGEDLLGFVLLAKPRTAIKLNWEVLDLLKTAGGQAAGYLAQMQATEALLEARKFEAFNRMSAFVVHDLKNIVAQLSLMLKNAERLHDNREFQQDMLLTVSSSLEKMKRLMLQLREGATPPGGSRGVELAPILRKLAAMAKAQGRQLEVEEVDRLSTRGHDDRLERVLGHLVQNALDATPATGRVWLSTERASGQVKVVVGDTGTGMDNEFVRSSLFRPFNTTKHSGMGIGSYESYQYIRELGGSIAVESQPGLGTVMTVLLPVFESERGSDLVRMGVR
jgi:putative PEP-CTERM system histidine kinase